MALPAFGKSIRNKVTGALHSHGAAATTSKKGGTLPGSGLCWELPIVLAEEEEVHPHGEDPHHVKRWEGSGCVLDPRMLDGVWQHDVQYMCKYSTTSFIDHFNENEHARSHCSRLQYRI